MKVAGILIILSEMPLFWYYPWLRQSPVTESYQYGFQLLRLKYLSN